MQSLLKFDPHLGRTFYEGPDRQPFYLGCHPSPVDRRCSFPLWQAPEVNLDSLVDFDFAQFEPDAYNQKQTNSCTGHGSAGGFGTAWNFWGRTAHRFSPFFIYSQINGGMDMGAAVSDTLTVLQEKGVCLEQTCPHGRLYLRDVPAEAYPEAGRFKVGQAYRLDTWGQTLSALACNFIVVFGCDVGTAFDPNGDGVLPPFRRGFKPAGHCMYMSGVKRIGGQLYARVRNSWGVTWGLRGTCYMPASYSQSGFWDAYAIQAAKDDPKEDRVPPLVRA